MDRNPSPLTDSARPSPSRILIAESDASTLESLARTIDEGQHEATFHFCTSSDESAAKEYGDRVIGVILTGLLKDGTAGLKAVHEAGGLTIVQDPTSAEYPDMPASAMKDLPVTFCLDLANIGPALDLLVRREKKLETGLAASVRMVKERVALLARLIAQSKRNPATSQFLSTKMIALELDLRSLEALVAKALVEDSASGLQAD